MLSVSGFHHLALKARRPGPLASFYRDVLGLEEQARHVDEAGLRSVWLTLGDGVLMVERADTPGPTPTFAEDPPGLHLLAFRIPPAERSAWIQRLAEEGHPVLARTPHTTYFADPEGHRFALSHWPEAGPESA